MLARSEPRWEFLRVDTPPAMAALIAWCLESDAARRPSMAAVLGHPVEAWPRPHLVGIADEELRRRPDGKVHFQRVTAVPGDDGAS